MLPSNTTSKAESVSGEKSRVLEEPGTEKRSNAVCSPEKLQLAKRRSAKLGQMKMPNVVLMYFQESACCKHGRMMGHGNVIEIHDEDGMERRGGRGSQNGTCDEQAHTPSVCR